MPADLDRRVVDEQSQRDGRDQERKRPEREFVRFTRLQRALHGCMIVSFISLAMTGMTLKFSYTAWAVTVSRLLERNDFAQRFAALGDRDSQRAITRRADRVIGPRRDLRQQPPSRGERRHRGHRRLERVASERSVLGQGERPVGAAVGAEREYRSALRLAPTSADFLNNLGLAGTPIMLGGAPVMTGLLRK